MENIREVAALLTGFKSVNELASNQIIVKFSNGILLQSYDCLVLVKLYGEEGNKIYLGEHYTYSKILIDRKCFIDNLSKGIYTLLKGK